VVHRPWARGRLSVCLCRLQRLVGGGCPHEPGQLAGDRDDDRALVFAAAAEPAPALVETLLGAQGAGDGERLLVTATALDGVAGARPAAVIPGRLDEQPAGVIVAGLGD
jgi:hypothetical protein